MTEEKSMKRGMYYLAAYEGIKLEAERVIRYDNTLIHLLPSVRKALVKERFKVEDDVWKLNYEKKEISEIVRLGAERAIETIKKEIPSDKYSEKEITQYYKRLERFEKNLVDKAKLI